MSSPKVSILMPVYNSEKYLKEAIDSILNQTFTDFEFVIINDGSTDRSVEIVESYNDPRIKLFHNEQNLDLVKTLNKGLDLCKGEYIARMDADDISHPNRIRVQVDYMDNNLEVGLCGSGFEMFGAASATNVNPETHNEIKATLFFVNCIAHPTVMFRKSMLDKYNLRYEKHLSEDYELWQRCSFLFQMHNLKDVLLDYRINSTSYSQLNTKKVWNILDDLIQHNLERFNLKASTEELEFHKIISNKLELNSSQYRVGAAYISKLLKANDQKNVYPKLNFNLKILELWLYSFKLVKVGNLKKVALFWNVPLYFLIFLLKSRASYKFTLERIKEIFNK